jgi:tRNA_anti-like
MYQWTRKHWPRVAGAIGLLQPLWKFVSWLVTMGGDVDFVISRSSDPGWVGHLINFLFYPPAWVPMLVAVCGFGLIFWDIRRNKHTDQVNYRSNSQDITHTKGENAQIFVKSLPTHVLKAYAEGTSIQAEELAKHYIGKWIKCSGAISDIFNKGTSVSAFILSKQDVTIYAEFNILWKEKIVHLMKGDKITVEGVIKSICSNHIHLVGCALIE